jgi:hypothetical protein
LKGLRKINALSSRFAAQICDLARDAVKTRKLGRFGELAETLGSVAAHAPAGTLGTVVKDVETVDDLKAISRWVKAGPNEAVVALHLDGKGATELMKDGRRLGQGNLAILLRKGAAGLTTVRPAVRGLKFVYRGRIGQIRDALLDWAAGSPIARTVALGAVVICGLAAALLAISALNALGRVLWPTASAPVIPTRVRAVA